MATKAGKLKQEESKLKQEELHLFQKVGRMREKHQVIFSLVIFFALVLMWTGGQRLVETYFFPDSPLFGGITAIVIGLIILGSTHYLAKEFMVAQ